MKLIFKNQIDTENFANVLAKVCEPPLIIFLEGELGVGRDKLGGAFLRAKGYEGKVKSPTYTLIESYDVHDQTVVHVDLYRISDPEEIEYLALKEQLTAKSIAFIEWPNHTGAYGIEADLILNLRIAHASERELKITTTSKLMSKIKMGLHD